MSERYEFTLQDGELLWAAGKLLRKVMGSDKIRPAQMVTLAKLQHVLSILPRATDSVTASVSVGRAPRSFGEVETRHWWEFSIEEVRLKISCGGHFYRPSTGGDTFTTMVWEAVPGLPAALEDYSELHRIVPDLCSFAEGVESIDFSKGSYSLEIYDDDNALLEEQDDDEHEGDDEVDEVTEEKNADTGEEADEETPEPWSITPVDAFETWIASQVDAQQVDDREPIYNSGVEECGVCGCNLNKRGLHVDGRLRGKEMWSNMCTECLKGSGEGIGWGKGQLYARQPNGAWRLVAGFEPEEK
jgi:hypothetical protein